MKVEIWGRVGSGWLSSHPKRENGKGKEAEVERDPTGNPENGWQVLEEWDVTLADLVPLPDDVSLPERIPQPIYLMSSTSWLLTRRVCHPILS
jgi:hypothetical protein